MRNDNRTPAEPTPISDPDAPKQDAATDHKVAAHPPADEREDFDDQQYQAEESGE